ncbi:unnamed protein product [Schistocephalus solidus]|nr:unnamed protein product [Schistocephalus solidus]
MVADCATTASRQPPSPALSSPLIQSCLTGSVIRSCYSICLQLLLLGCLVASAVATPLAVGKVDDVTTFSLRNALGSNPLVKAVRTESVHKSDALALDPRRIMCGYQLIANLKLQCGARGTYSPYDHGARVRRSLRMGYEQAHYRPRNPDDICALYLLYEPHSVITECCCRGCTRRYLDQFCAKG